MKKIIACLDIKDGKTVKGVQYKNLKEIADPVELAIKYNNKADLLTVLDISASEEKRTATKDLIKRILSNIEIPLILGGGISNLNQIEEFLNLGVSKISIGSAAVESIDFLKEASIMFPNKIVLALDCKKTYDDYYLFVKGGKENTQIQLFDFLDKIKNFDLFALLITSMDADGRKTGYDIDLYNYASLKSNFSIIASGGAGKIEDFIEVFKKTSVDYALAASVFHYDEVDILNLKENLKENLNENLNENFK